MSAEHQQLEAGIEALEAQRSLLGDAVADMTAAQDQAKLVSLHGTVPPTPPGGQRDIAARSGLVEINLTSNAIIHDLHGARHPFLLYRKFGGPTALSANDTLRGRLAGIEMISYLTGPLIGNARAGFMADAWGVSRCSTNWELRRTTSATRPESVSL